MYLTNEQTLITDMANAFARDEMRPNAQAWEQSKTLDRKSVV